MHPVLRWIIAILLALILLVVNFLLYTFGYFLGGMATASCSTIFSFGGISYLDTVWPFVLATSAIIPSLLIIARVKWRFVILGVVLGGVASGVAYVIWFPLLGILCR